MSYGQLVNSSKTKKDIAKPAKKKSPLSAEKRPEQKAPARSKNSRHTNRQTVEKLGFFEKKARKLAEKEKNRQKHQKK